MPAVRDKTTTDLSPPRTRSRVSIPTRLWSPPSVVPSPDHTSTSSASTSAPHLVSPAARRRKGPDYIPRPPNAFILFRQTLFKQLKEGAIEHDQRLFSQIISTTWAELGAADKEVWYKQAADLKEAHTQKYPNYRFSPVVRMDKPRKRNVKRNGPKDKERCRRLGKLIAQGRDIHELEREAKRIDATMREDGGAGKGASELGIPVSENYSTSIFDLTLCDPCDTTDASTPQPSTPRLSGPHIGIPTYAEWSPASKSFCAPPTPIKQPIGAFSSCLIFSSLSGARLERTVPPQSTPALPLDFPSIKHSPQPEPEALFLPSTPSPPTFPTPLPIPADRLAPIPWAYSTLLADASGLDEDWAWFPTSPSLFDASTPTGSSSSSPPASSPATSSTPSTPPQHFPPPFIPSPTVASSPIHASPFKPHSPFDASALSASHFYPSEGMYANAMSSPSAAGDDVWLGTPAELQGMGIEGENGMEGLGLYDSLMNENVLKGYMG